LYLPVRESDPRLGWRPVHAGRDENHEQGVERPSGSADETD